MSSAPRILALDQAEFVPWCGNSETQGLIVNGGAEIKYLKTTAYIDLVRFADTHSPKVPPHWALRIASISLLGVHRCRTRLEDLLKRRAIDKGMVPQISSSPRPTKAFFGA